MGPPRPGAANDSKSTAAAMAKQLIKPILENEAKQMQGLREDRSLSKQERMNKMQQIRHGTLDQIKPILK
jgi:hypothetical protein